MKHLLSVTRSCSATILVAAIALSAYGCADTVSVSPDVTVPLSSLTVTPGSLQPGFFSNTTNYAVDVSTSVTSVTVTASPKESTTTMTINGVVTNPGQGRAVPLSSSGTTTNIAIVLMNQNGVESTYEVIVRKVDNNLSALSVTPGSLIPAFTANRLNYQVEVSSGVASVTVLATKLDPRAIMSGSVTAGAGVTTGQATIPLNGAGSATVVSITVAVLNGDTKTYTITVNRLSGDNNLEDLTVTPGNFNRPFEQGITDYIVNVASNDEQVRISARKSDILASMSGHLTAGPGIQSDTEIFGLGGQGSETSFVITVAAQDPSVVKNYNITVRRPLPAAPAAPTSAPDMTAETDSGPDNSDNITNITTPSFRVAKPGSGETLHLYVGGVKVGSSFDPLANTLTPTLPLDYGTHPITSTLANVGGESGQSPPLIVTIELATPPPSP